MSEQQPRKYHHGDLRRAILDEGLTIVRESGLDALAVRDVTRRLGVAPNAAYRHYADRNALVAELAGAVQETLSLRIQDAIRRAERNHTPLTPQTRLVAFARGYVTFAINEPAWFDLLCRGHAERATSRPAGDHTRPSPHELLQATLDDLIATGVIPQHRVHDAIWMVWAALDGSTRLASDGPLQAWSRARLATFVEQTIGVVLAGLTSSRP